MAEELEKPTLVIPLESYQKIMGYAKAATGEITGFADVEWDKEELAFKVGEVYLIEQEATGATVEMSADDVSDFTFKLIKKGITQLPRLWWHSHVDMGAFFSATDQATIKNFKNDSFLVALVVNKREELEACVRLFEPMGITLNNIPVEVDYGSVVNQEALAKEVAKKVKKPVPHVYQPPVNNTQNFLHGSGGRTDFKSAQQILEGTPESQVNTFNLAGVLRLPKDTEEALDRIVSFDLTYLFSEKHNTYIFKNETSGIEYWDFWGTFADMEPEQVYAEIEEYRRLAQDYRLSQR